MESSARDNRYQQSQQGSSYNANAINSYLNSSAAHASEQYSRNHPDRSNVGGGSVHSRSIPPQQPPYYGDGDDHSVGSASYYSREGDYHRQQEQGQQGQGQRQGQGQGQHRQAQNGTMVSTAASLTGVYSSVAESPIATVLLLDIVCYR